MQIKSLLSVAIILLALTACGPNLEDAQKLGFESVEQMQIFQKAGFQNMNEFRELGFKDLIQMEEYQKAGFKNMSEFTVFGFADLEELKTMNSNGFENKSEYEKSKLKNEELGIDLTSRNNVPYPFCKGEEPKEWSDCIGVRDLKNGSIFTGEMHNGKAIGKGEYVFSHGGKFIGDVDGVPNGHGILINPDKSTFEGEFKDGQKHGFGVVKDPEGKEVWAGKWVMGARDILSKRETINQAMSIEEIANCSAAYAVVSKYSDKLKNYQLEIEKAKQRLIENGHGRIVREIYTAAFYQASSSSQYGISLVRSCNEKLDKIAANWSN